MRQSGDQRFGGESALLSRRAPGLHRGQRDVVADPPPTRRDRPIGQFGIAPSPRGLPFAILGRLLRPGDPSPEFAQGTPVGGGSQERVDHLGHRLALGLGAGAQNLGEPGQGCGVEPGRLQRVGAIDQHLPTRDVRLGGGSPFLGGGDLAFGLDRRLLHIGDPGFRRLQVGLPEADLWGS